MTRPGGTGLPGDVVDPGLPGEVPVPESPDPPATEPPATEPPADDPADEP